jgi:hypothetical protein
MLWKVQRFVEHFLRHFCIIFDHFNADPFKQKSNKRIVGNRPEVSFNHRINQCTHYDQSMHVYWQGHPTVREERKSVISDTLVKNETEMDQNTPLPAPQFEDQRAQPGIGHSFFLAQMAGKGLAALFGFPQIE